MGEFGRVHCWTSGGDQFAPSAVHCCHAARERCLNVLQRKVGCLHGLWLQPNVPWRGFRHRCGARCRVTRASVARCWEAVFANLVARHTWVPTLMSITLLSEDTAVREGFKIVLSAVGTARRTMWAVFRLKHEHLAK